MQLSCRREADAFRHDAQDWDPLVCCLQARILSMQPDLRISELFMNG